MKKKKTNTFEPINFSFDLHAWQKKLRKNNEQFTTKKKKKN